MSGEHASSPARRALLLAAAALPACVAMPGGGTLEAPAPRVGDRWRYRIVDVLEGGRWLDEPSFEVIEARPTLRVRVVSRRDPQPSEERFAAPWVALAERLEDVVVTYADPVPVVPTAAGSGSITTTWTDPRDGRALRWSQTLTLGGAETIEVPAGRFDCLRVSRTVAFTHPDPSRSGATRSETLWFAPAARRWVRRSVDVRYIADLTGGRSAAAVGEAGLDTRVLWELTAWLPAPHAA